MFKRQMIFVKSMIILLCIFFAEMTFAETLVYKHSESGKESNSESVITKSDDGYISKGTNDFNKDIHTLNMDSSFSTLKWKYVNEEKGTDIIAERSENIILITGIFKNEKVEKKLKVNELPWFQDWGLGQKEFIKSDKDTFYFWSIEPNSLRIAKFECKKTKTEKIKVNGQEVESVCVKVGLTGLLKAFWSGGEMWFRKSDGVHVYSMMDLKKPDDNTQLISER